ncbi:MAG: N-6 DNA methylase [bacterium]|nr:N-6 DNA methylase [bacterium]
MAKKVQSIEPNIADLANGWLKKYKLDYKLEQESLNSEIDKALDYYASKSGGTGGNRPDAKLLLENQYGEKFPVLIEYKGKKDALVKLDNDNNVENRTAKNEPNFKNIKDYAVNGAVHYANALLHHTAYTDIIAIGMTGEKDEKGKIRHQISVYYVSKKNLGVGQKVGEFSDFSFLAKENTDAFIEQVKNLSLSPEELDKLKEKREKEIDASLAKLNNDIYQNEKGLDPTDRVYLVAATIIATLGVPAKDGEPAVKPLEKDELKSNEMSGERDGDIIIRRINAFFSRKKLPKDKKDLIIRTLSNTLLTENINKAHNGESQLKRVFTKIVDDLGIYYKIGLTTDFTGKLFNEMYSWLPFDGNIQRNDVVLTPPYVATLLVKLARVNKDSYVWDFATGSAGLLVAAMNEMLKDAKENIHSPEELHLKEAHIKGKQLLGLELLSSVYMLAILNMIMMGDGSSNIINKNSLTDFDGNYGFGNKDEKFPADAFILNPPYSADGNGMNFVETALGMMHKGYAAIIIQNSAGSGKAKEINQRILQKHTLIASIKMPIDLFIGKSSVQTNIYVFKVGEKHKEKSIVKFINFSNDGYTRTNRKKASNNLKDTDRARERYQEVVDLVEFGKNQLNIFTEKEYYENTIATKIDTTKEENALAQAKIVLESYGDKESVAFKKAEEKYFAVLEKLEPLLQHNNKVGADWNQTAPIDTKPTLDDFKKTVSDYLAWEVSNLLKKQDKTDDRLGK